MSRVTAIALLLACSLQGVLCDNNGRHDFHLAGFPTMALFIGLALVALGIWYGRKENSVGVESALGKIFFVLNILTTLMAIFLIFGPGENNGGGVRVNAIGAQLFGAAAVGFYAAFSNNRPAAILAFVLTSFNLLCLFGAASFFSYMNAIWNVSYADCLGYFVTDDLNRCDDKGFLQLIRTFGMFTILLQSIQFFQLYLAITASSGKVLGNSPIEGVSNAGLTRHAMPTGTTDFTPIDRATASTYQQQYNPPAAQPYIAPSTGTTASGYQNL